MAGGWVQAARLPAINALRWIDERNQGRKIAAWDKAVDRYYAMLPAFAGSGNPPDPPEPPDLD